MKGFLEVLFFIYYCVAKKYGIYIEDTFFGNSLLPSPLNSLAKTENLRGIQQKQLFPLSSKFYNSDTLLSFFCHTGETQNGFFCTSFLTKTIKHEKKILFSIFLASIVRESRIIGIGVHYGEKPRANRRHDGILRKPRNRHHFLCMESAKGLPHYRRSRFTNHKIGLDLFIAR